MANINSINIRNMNYDNRIFFYQIFSDESYMIIKQHRFDIVEINISGDKIFCKYTRNLKTTLNNICICVADAINFANYKNEMTNTITRSSFSSTFAHLMNSLDTGEKIKNKLSIFKDINSYTSRILNDDSFIYRFSINNLKISIYTIYSLVVLDVSVDDKSYKLYIRRDNVSVARIILVLEKYLKLKNAGAH